MADARSDATPGSFGPSSPSTADIGRAFALCAVRLHRTRERMAFHGGFATGRLQAILTHVRHFTPASSIGACLTIASTAPRAGRFVDDLRTAVERLNLAGLRI